jgi:hypothetical protein
MVSQVARFIVLGSDILRIARVNGVILIFAGR